MADYLKCTIEFLIGRSANESPIVGNNYPPIAKRIKEVMKESGISSYFSLMTELLTKAKRLDKLYLNSTD